MSRPERWKIIGAFALVYFVWGSTYLAIRVAVESIPPFLLAAIRFLCAGSGMFWIARLGGAPLPSAREWYEAGIIGTFLLVGANGMVCWSEQTVPSGLTALLLATNSLWTVTLESLWFAAPWPKGRVLVGLVTGLVGVVLLLGLGRPSSEGVAVWGAAGLMFACASWAFGSLRSQRVHLPNSVFLVSGIEMLIGGGILLIVSAGLGEWARVDRRALAPAPVLALAYLIVFGSMLTFSAFAWLLRHCRAATVSTYAYVNPIVAVLLGTWWGEEPFTWEMLGGAALILGSIFLVTSSKAQA